MTASEFISAQREQMQERSDKRFWTPEELERALSDAAAALQTDIPMFTGSAEIDLVPWMATYQIDADFIDIVSVKIDGVVYEQVPPTRFHQADDRERVYMTQPGTITISPAPGGPGKMNVDYIYIREQAPGHAPIVVPRQYMEALRLNFLFRVYEKQPDRKSRDLATYYLRLYDREIERRKRSAGSGQGRVRSIYRRV